MFLGFKSHFVRGVLTWGLLPQEADELRALENKTVVSERERVTGLLSRAFRQPSASSSSLHSLSDAESRGSAQVLLFWQNSGFLHPDKNFFAFQPPQLSISFSEHP